MEETEFLNNEMEGESEKADDSYANAYLNDDDDDAHESDDEELAEMLAKVQSIQETEMHVQPTEPSTSTLAIDLKDNSTDATLNVSGRLSPKGAALIDSKKAQSIGKSSLNASAALSSRASKSQDGITTISRSALSTRTAGVGTMLGVKKAAIYEEKLLKAMAISQSIEKLRQKVVAAPPGKIGKRIETLSAPLKTSATRKFATDDEEQHCRFRTRKTAAQRAKEASGEDFDSGDSGENFVSRMEASERHRQKKLEMSRGENDYNARLDKKSCPKCEIPQSYSEFRDKKKKCQMCGVEFRFLNAWGDIERDFISRMAEASRTQAEKKDLIYAQMATEAANRPKVTKSKRQLQYEKKIAIKYDKQSFLVRNYKSTSSDSKAKKAQLELESKRRAAQLARE